MTDFTKFLKQANLTDGKWVGADNGTGMDVINPATLDVLGTVPNAGAAETNLAIEAVGVAFKNFGDKIHLCGGVIT